MCGRLGDLTPSRHVAWKHSSIDRPSHPEAKIGVSGKAATKSGAEAGVALVVAQSPLELPNDDLLLSEVATLVGVCRL